MSVFMPHYPLCEIKIQGIEEIEDIFKKAQKESLSLGSDFRHLLEKEVVMNPDKDALVLHIVAKFNPYTNGSPEFDYRGDVFNADDRKVPDFIYLHCGDLENIGKDHSSRGIIPQEPMISGRAYGIVKDMLINDKYKKEWKLGLDEEKYEEILYLSFCCHPYYKRYFLSNSLLKEAYNQNISPDRRVSYIAESLCDDASLFYPLRHGMYEIVDINRATVRTLLAIGYNDADLKKGFLEKRDIFNDPEYKYVDNQDEYLRIFESMTTEDESLANRIIAQNDIFASIRKKNIDLNILGDDFYDKLKKLDENKSIDYSIL